MEVRVEGLTKRYGFVTALDGVTQAFPSGALTVIVGPSGCGKTTLLRSLAGFVAPDSGRVWMGERDVTLLPPQVRDCAMVFQNYALWPHMTVFENLAFGLRLRKVPAPDIPRRVREALELVELDRISGIEHRRPRELSGGQQQRVALARAVAVRPQVLLLDEPLSNLDAKIRHRVRVEIRALQRRTGITTIYVTHDQEEAMSIADLVVVMDSGRVAQAGRPEEVYAHPADPFVAEFLGATNVLAATVDSDGLIRPSHRGTLMVRAEDIDLVPLDTVPERATPPPAGTAWADGEVVDVLFLGAGYRAYVRVGDEVLMADHRTPLARGKVRMVIPREKIFVFERPREPGTS
ncbi:MAG: ABC transporter ATP-binding protein [Armatimonadota bacterium]|nr:ABC transporter ATP-binding protein [Armatimonadota bacterium]MDR7540391.1 ABC transporter ATP-binding protein [Armatimonadota bacterium]